MLNSWKHTPNIGIFSATRQGIIIFANISPADEKFTFNNIEMIKIIKIKITVTIIHADR